ncbi:Re/Si-specific NAD(P)(+) transhydrogenase subunit alpha [Shewanella sp. Isolate11]|uniref:Re/Si-specific NAD(P)(+) transhydrogenase subunit alpha n=1 Tax=Shewanella sp. Isolate11 TaxID=2908530 RepID=UPI001EFEBBE9|nr:Re/Si-specific NAD(P)(+) transhydrogenase subunit alpha [Shewanella sp. Isolate11]MCG9697570.1 Re/Si-specific NAD(P)(+) transhydrogenase subunit alpha [Shewanella sp. Isolate11]
MQIGIPRESLNGETRVAATPATVVQLTKLGFEVAIEAGAGQQSSFDDAAFEAAGASVVDKVWDADFIFKVNAPDDAEIELLKAGTTLVSFIWPAQNPELVEKLSKRNVTVMAMDMVPRISRAQSLDALSSMANIGGYRAVVEAAHQFGRFFTGQITAAGKVPPAKVLVIGAGVAGLAAIGTAGSLGAIVRAFDTRLEVAEQIESMGGEFLKLDFGDEEGGSSDGYAKTMSDEFIAAEMALFAEQAKEVDIIITTALIPGRPAPKLITKAMVDSMKPGSVIVDLAAATGGNCEYTQSGELIVTDNGVKVIGYTDLPGRLPAQSSQLYGTNLVNLMKLMCKEKDGNAVLDFDDVVMRNMTVTRDGEITFPPPAISVSAAPQQPAAKAEPAPVEVKKPSKLKYILGALGLIGFGAVASVAPAEFLSHFTVFVLSCVVGYYVVWNVSHSLHTPLMSVTNAISGIIVVGALLQIGHGSTLTTVLAFIAVLIASINIFGGFTVTQRMLKMFRKN